MPRASYFRTSSAEEVAYSDKETRAAWEKLVTSSGVPEISPDGVRSEIFASWQRSMDIGVDAGIQRSRKIINETELFKRQANNASLRAAASAAFKRLEPHLREAQTMLILADDEGVVIDAIGDADVLDQGKSIHLEIGGDWSEDAVGTNGIGTALMTGIPTYVHAAEHFAEGVQSWTCAGVPIRDPFTNSVAGVVDLSGPPQIFRKHNIALVMAAAREIEIALAEHHRLERTQVLEAFLMSSHGRSNNSVLLLDRTGRLLFQRSGNEDGLTFPSFTIGKRLLPKLEGLSERDIAKCLPPEVAPNGFERLTLEGNVLGGALFLKDRVRTTSLQNKTKILKPRPNVAEQQLGVVGASPKMLEAIELAERVAKANVPVLIQGETGVGKELFARLVHCGMAKEDAPYVPVNCAAISSELIGAELFGYVDGAFTGAAKGGRVGKFETANGGVLCLDEIGEMPIELQPYLLRALEQRAIYRIGENRRRPVDVKLVAMTNRDLRQEIEQGNFRRDLFYRIGVVTIDVPPLRERGDDLVLLIEAFCKRVAKELDRPLLSFSSAAIDLMASYQWPGNVRELLNVVQRSYLVATSDVVGVQDLPTEIRSGLAEPGDEHMDQILRGNSGDLESIEANAIRRTILREGGNLTKVASILGISRPTLYRKIKQYKIRKP